MRKIDKKDMADILALTPMQEGMLFHYLKEPRSDYYFEQLTLQVSGDIDVEIFKKTWNVVIQTNEMLRTFFRWEQLDRPTQVILKEHTLNLGYHDLSTAEKNENLAENKGQVEKIKLQDRMEKFDLRDVPFRVSLCKVSEGNYYIIISNHHILYDGWSTGVILREFIQAYEALHKEEPLPLSSNKPLFKEFIRCQHKRDRDKEKKFWNSYLKGLDTPTQLPIKQRRHHLGGTDGDVYGFVLEKSIKDKLEVFLKESRITLAAFLYSGWGILLRKYCNSDDIVFGTTVSGRSAPVKGIEEMVGLFINTLPLRIKTHSNERFADFLSKMNQALQVQKDYEAAALVDIKEYSGFTTNEELFDTVMVIENYPLDNRWKQANGPISVDSYSMVERTHYDLTVCVTVGDEIECNFYYHKGVLDKESIIRLSHHFIAVIEDVIGDPLKNVSGMEIVSVEERRQLLIDFNSTDADYPRHKTIHQLFEDQAHQTPDHTALVFDQQDTAERYMSTTYRVLNEQSGQLACLLKEKCVEPDTIVGIMVERSIRMVVGIMAILKAGGAYLPIDPEFPGERIAYILADSSAHLLVTTRSLAKEGEKPGSWEGETILLEPAAAVSSSSTLTSTLTCQVSPANLAYIIYTSGSTGKPKGVTIEHGSVVNLLWGLNQLYPFTAFDVYLLKTSYLFDVSVTELFGWFPGGGRLVLLGKDGEKDPRKIIEAIEYSGVTHINFVPSQFNVLVDGLNPQDIKRIFSLKYIFLAGEALLPELVNKFKALNGEVRLENLYGPTEAAVYASIYSLAQWQGTGPIPIGKPFQNTQLYILDQDDQLQPIGVPGELCIAGVGVAKGYFKRQALTAEKFINNPFSRETYAETGYEKLYRTGDLARWMPDGNIEFLGRIDYQVKIRGFRIELGEIENQLLNHPAVKEAVAAAALDKTGDHFLCVYVVPSSWPALEITQLRHYLQQKLPDYMIPAHFVTLEEIPLTATGKIDRKSLPQPEITSTREYAAPRHENERVLIDIWADVLGLDKQGIGLDHNFFELGGHSLRAIRLIGRLHKKMNIEIPLDVLFKLPTVRRLAEYINQAGTTLYCEIKPVEKKDYYNLSSAQQRHFVLQQMDPNSTVYNMPEAMILGGHVEKERLEATFTELIHRNETLRTSFELINEEPVQRIHEKVDFAIEYYSLKLPTANCQLTSFAPLICPGHRCCGWD